MAAQRICVRSRPSGFLRGNGVSIVSAIIPAQAGIHRISRTFSHEFLNRSRMLRNVERFGRLAGCRPEKRPDLAWNDTLEISRPHGPRRRKARHPDDRPRAADFGRGPVVVSPALLHAGPTTCPPSFRHGPRSRAERFERAGSPRRFPSAGTAADPPPMRAPTAASVAGSHYFAASTSGQCSIRRWAPSGTLFTMSSRLEIITMSRGYWRSIVSPAACRMTASAM